MPETKPTETKVESITIEDMENLLGIPGASVAMVPGEQDPKPGQAAATEKPSFFQTKQVDMSFLDEAEPPAPTEEETARLAPFVIGFAAGSLFALKDNQVKKK